MALENSINDQNKNLYNKLKDKGVDISLEVNANLPCWQVARTYKISSPNNEANPAAMAHELLHIDLDLKGFADDIYTYSHFNTKNSSFTYEFIGKTNNSLAHFKMLDEFLAMGFSVDSFLADTPKTYFLQGMIFKPVLVQLHVRAGTFELCKEILEVIHLIAGAKLFELYKIKEPNTENGLHIDAVLEPLREINKELIDSIAALFDEWYNTNTVNNLHFYHSLHTLLQQYNIKTYDECNGVEQ